LFNLELGPAAPVRVGRPFVELFRLHMLVAVSRHLSLHKSVCLEVAFPNAQMNGVQSFYDELGKTIQGKELIKKLKLLAGHRGNLL